METKSTAQSNVMFVTWRYLSRFSQFNLILRKLISCSNNVIIRNIPTRYQGDEEDG